MKRRIGRAVTWGLSGLIFFSVLSARVYAAPPVDSSGVEPPAAIGSLKPLLVDGATIKSIEQYAQPSPNQLGLSAGILPLDPYYFGFQAAANFSHYFSEKFAWEVFNAASVFSVEKNLTVDLANNFGVNPKQINRLNYIISSNAFHFFSYGKAVMFGDLVRYFRTGFMWGAGAVMTSQKTQMAGNLGLKMEFYAGSGFSWRIEVRNSTTIGDMKNYPTFALGAGIGL